MWCANPHHKSVGVALCVGRFSKQQSAGRETLAGNDLDRMFYTYAPVIFGVHAKQFYEKCDVAFRDVRAAGVLRVLHEQTLQFGQVVKRHRRIEVVADVHMDVIGRDHQAFEKIRFNMTGHLEQILMMILNAAEMFSYATNVNDPKKVCKERHKPIKDQSEPEMKNNACGYHGKIKSESRYFELFWYFTTLIYLS
jgi:hypothetical protein